MGNDENGRNKDNKNGLLSRAYDAVDNNIMYGVSKMVRGYNWTTGGTKAELANGFMVGAAVTFSVGTLLINPVFGSIITLAMLPSTHYRQNKNVEIEGKEAKALEKGLFDTDVENYKGRCRLLGGFNLPLSALNGGIGLLLNREPYLLVGMGSGLSVLDCYVMRADNLPPRKNCLRRGAEKLKDIVSSYLPKPAVAPAGV